MGLGKTLMMISLIILHPFPVKLSKHPIDGIYESNSTLIVTPDAILDQWIQEIKKFAPHLNVLHYKAHIDSPEELLEYDVIILPISLLRTELNYSKPVSDRSRRNEVKYVHRRSPLISVCWWRIILDEAQMVESNTKAYGIQIFNLEMSSFIPRVNSWAVTGTPASKTASFSDLAGVLTFTRLIDSHNQFLRLFSKLSPESIRVELSPFIHAQTKEHIASQIKLPPQFQETVHLSFESVEKVYYDDIYTEAKDEVTLLYNNYQSELALPKKDQNKKKIDKALEKLKFEMRLWILRLRQTWYF